MEIQDGVNTRVSVGQESLWGVKALANSGKSLRRVSLDINLDKPSFTSAEIRRSGQTSDMNLGTESVTGTLNGELSCGSYEDLFSALLRGDWTAGVTHTAATVAVATGKFVRSVGSWITAGYKIGDVVTTSGFTTPANNGSWIVSAITATDLSVVDTAAVLVVEAEGATATVAVAGKKLQIPNDVANQVRKSFSVEKYHTELDAAEVYTGVRIGSADISVQPNANTTVNFGLMGRTVELTENDSWFTAPTSPSNTGVVTSSRGVLLKDGAVIADLTSITANITGNLATQTTVFAPTVAGVSSGRITATGQFVAYFRDLDLFKTYRNETEFSLVMHLVGDTASESLVLKFPRVKASSNTKDDKESGGIMQTIAFTMLEPKSSTTAEDSTVVIQDTTLA